MEQRALVLGGGGVTGIAWELGIVAGLDDAGIDLTAADLVIGTSAGAAVGAQLTSGADVHDLFARMHLPAERSTERSVDIDPDAFAAELAALVGATTDPVRIRVAIGAMALAAPTPPEADRLEIIAARLPSPNWPERPLIVTAVDATSGELAAFDRNSGVPLVHAVAASCAVPGVWPPVTIGANRYVDGAIRALANADLAAGYDRVVILAPFTEFAGLPLPTVYDEAATLPGKVITIAPDTEALDAIGPNALDARRQPAAADAGRAQARAIADAVRAVWTS